MALLGTQLFLLENRYGQGPPPDAIEHKSCVQWRLGLLQEDCAMGGGPGPVQGDVIPTGRPDVFQGNLLCCLCRIQEHPVT